MKDFKARMASKKRGAKGCSEMKGSRGAMVPKGNSRPTGGMERGMKKGRS
jgi:hypothetical protein